MKLYILKATYGTDDKRADVTARVQALVLEGVQLNIIVNSALLGGDAGLSAVPRYLQCTYLLTDGTAVETKLSDPIADGRHMYISAPEIPARLVITKAMFGPHEGRAVDVTDRVSRLVCVGKALAFTVSAALLGGDPFPGEKGCLFLQYSIDGASPKKADPIPEGREVSIIADDIDDGPIAGEEDTTPKLEVLRACFGTDTIRLDVTEKVKTYLVRSKALIFHVRSDALGADPAPTSAKHLSLHYKVGDDVCRKKIPENALVVIRAPMAALPARLMIDRAVFAGVDKASDKLSDVTAVVRSFVINGAVLRLPVDAAVLGNVDPAPGIAKQLILYYHIDAGPVRVATALEGSLLHVEI